MRRPSKIALLSLLLVLVLIGVAYAVEMAAHRPGSSIEVNVPEMVQSDHGGCRAKEDPPQKVPQGLFGPAHRVIVNTTVIGCGKSLGDWFLLVAYLQADHQARQLCYGLEQPSGGAKSGGACVHVSAAVPICRMRCQLGTSGLNPAHNGVSETTVVSGAVEGRMKTLMLSLAGRRSVHGLRPMVGVISGGLAKKFRLRRDVSIFAYLVEPCLTAGQRLSVVAGMEKGRSVDLSGTAFAECG